MITLQAIGEALAAYVYDLSDPKDPWFGEDKVQHLGWAGFFWAVLLARVGPMPLVIVLFLAGAVGLEVLEVIRFRAWLAKRQPQPWPFLTDKASVKDFLYDCAGAVLAQYLIVGHL